MSEDPLFATESVASGRYRIAGPFDAIVHEQSLLIFFGAEQGGLHLAKVPLFEAVPSSFGEELPSEWQLAPSQNSGVCAQEPAPPLLQYLTPMCRRATSVGDGDLCDDPCEDDGAEDHNCDYR